MSPLFSRKKKEISSFAFKGHTLHYRMPLLREKENFHKDADTFIEAVASYRKARSEHEKEHGFPPYPYGKDEEEVATWKKERRKAIEEYPFYHEFELDTDQIEVVIQFFVDIITKVDGLEDEDGPYQWADLDKDQRSEFLETVLGLPSLFSFYLDIVATIQEIDLKAYLGSQEE